MEGDDAFQVHLGVAPPLAESVRSHHREGSPFFFFLYMENVLLAEKEEVTDSSPEVDLWSRWCSGRS